MISQLWRFPLWWYKEAPEHFPYLLRNITLLWEDLIAIRLMARFLFVPMFHDVTVWGRVLSFAYRLGRIIFGIVSLILIEILMLIFFVFWFIFPLYLLYYDFRTVFLFLLAAVVFAVISQEKSRKKIGDSKGPADFERIASDELQNILQNSKTVYDLLTNLLKDTAFCQVLIKAGFNRDAFLTEIEKNKGQLETIQNQDQLYSLILEKAKSLSAQKPKPSHLFLVLLDLSPTLQEIVAKLDFDKAILSDAVSWGDNKEVVQPKFIWDKDFNFYTLAGVNRTLEGTVTPSLDPYIRDLTSEAKKGVLPAVVERKALTDEVALILSRSGENNVILVGETGSGKTYLVYSLAKRIIEGGAPSPLRFKRVVALDYSALLAGTKTEGEILERMKKIIEEIEYSGNIILFLDEVQNLIAGDNQRNAVYSALEPHLSSSRFQVIAAISYENYHATLEQNEEFANLFQKVEMSEASEEETLAILKTASAGFEKRQKVLITYPALVAAIDFSKRYIHDRVLPDKAVSILDEAAVLASTHSGGIVSKEEVAKVISVKTHLPVTKVSAQESEKLLNLEAVLHQRMVDQEEAVVAVADALRRARAGIREEGRPIASFLFVGPTGVGKTELARTLAEFYFGSEETMIRLDMSEFQDKESIFSLIGPPLGQKGSELGGRLTEAVRRRPFALLLLDEMEKSHPDILNLFLQVMDEARLTDSAGRTVDFSNTIIIATSNAGTRLIQEELIKATPMEKIKTAVIEFLKTIFKPEFLNRFDGIVVFKPLSPQDVEKVAELMIKKLTDNLTKKGIKVETTPQLLARLAQVGYDPTLGARPLRRLIQDKVEAKIAKEILKGELRRGSTLILDESLLAEEQQPAS